MFWLTVGGDFGRQARCRREGASVFFFFRKERDIFRGIHFQREEVALRDRDI